MVFKAPFESCSMFLGKENLKSQIKLAGLVHVALHLFFSGLVSREFTTFICNATEPYIKFTIAFLTL